MNYKREHTIAWVSFAVTVLSFFTPFVIVPIKGLHYSISLTSMLFTPQDFVKDTNRIPFIVMFCSVLATMVLPLLIIRAKALKAKINLCVALVIISGLFHLLTLGFIFTISIFKPEVREKISLGPAPYLLPVETILCIILLISLSRKSNQ